VRSARSRRDFIVSPLLQGRLGAAFRQLILDTTGG
jgi:hypothetical protein